MSSTQPIKIGLVDDHKLFRGGLKGLIESLNNSYQIIFEANNGIDLQRKLNPNSLPDIILMDVNMPEMDGFESVLWLNEHHPSLKVLVVSMIEREEIVVKMLKLGVKGYLCKDVEPYELNEALTSVMNKDFYYTDFITGRLVHALRSDDLKNELPFGFDQMNDREKEFIQHACTEMTYNEIADKMCVSPKTVDGYRSALFEKLKVKSRVGLAMCAVRNEWVSL